MHPPSVSQFAERVRCSSSLKHVKHDDIQPACTRTYASSCSGLLRASFRMKHRHRRHRRHRQRHFLRSSALHGMQLNQVHVDPPYIVRYSSCIENPHLCTALTHSIPSLLTLFSIDQQKDQVSPPLRFDQTTNTMASSIPQPKTYEGNCHCRLIKYTATLPEALAPEGKGKINRCNCSICTKNGKSYSLSRFFTLAKLPLSPLEETQQTVRNPGISGSYFPKRPLS